MQAGNRPLQELKKISIVEAKGYCYGWHFYQCADADLVISSDDALFGHPSFRYYGWGPRMWTWVQMMGLRKFQELMATHPAPIFQNAGETAEHFAQRKADYTLVYKLASLDVYTAGFFIAAILCLVALVFALWLRPKPGSDVESAVIF